MHLRRSALIALPVVALAFAAAGCAPKSEEVSTGTFSPTASGSGSAAADQCTPATLQTKTAGQLTIATDSPAYDPYFEKNNPSNGKGFESAVAYAVAKQLGYTNDQVTWVKQAFNTSYTPGPKKFDFDINQISITPQRAEHVDFSDGYYDVDQAVITLDQNAGKASTLADLKNLKLGAQTATTSLTAIRDDVQPTKQPLVFDTDDQAKQALLNGQVDALVVDLPTAFYMTAVELPHSTITGQFKASGTPEQFGLLLEKGSPLTSCVDQAIEALKADGQLAAIQKQWLSDVVNVPELQ